MMTSTPVTHQQQTDGRTVREVVEFNQELVNEAWCRRIFRQLLQSLELQYAMQMPHRIISPDTVLVLDSGDPMLLPSPDDQVAHTSAAWSEAGDLHDLAAVVHYAITMEAPPAAPLRGRAPPDYSDTFINAVDRCLSRDPEQRPRNIEQLRNLLGIVQLGPAITPQPMHAIPRPDAAARPDAPARPDAVAAPVPVSHPAAAAHPAATESAAPSPREAAPVTDRARLQRWLLLLAAATVLLGALGALVALLHGADSRDALVLALPQEESAVRATPEPQAAPPASIDASTETIVTAPLPGAELPAPAHGAPAQLAQPAAPPTAVAVAPAAGQNVQPAPARPPAVASGASYKLDIKPWGQILVDGVDRGASPPLKRIILPPGQHIIRIINPNYPEHIVSVNASRGDSSVIELDFTEEDTE